MWIEMHVKQGLFILLLHYMAAIKLKRQKKIEMFSHISILIIRIIAHYL